jgi:cysteine synthase
MISYERRSSRTDMPNDEEIAEISASTVKVGIPCGSDIAYQITDEEALPILFDLIEQEGLVLGGSSAINIVGAMRLARALTQERPSSPSSRTVASATNPSSSIRTSCARRTCRYRHG